MTASAGDRPAILGGTPVRPAGPPTWPPVDPSVAAVLRDLAVNGEWGRYHGPWCDRLKAKLSAQLQVRHALLCSSGTAAVELALRGLGVGPGDEVVLAAYDFEANFKNVLLVGARPVLVDVRADDWQLDVGRLDAARSDCTRCVVASHLHGGLVDMPRLRTWCDEQRVGLVEDAAQASGASLGGRPAGSWGDAGILSFGGSKLLTAGRGGAVLTDRDDVAQRIRLYTQRGNDSYPLSEMQAAVLAPQLERLSERHQRRSAAAAWLRERLEPFGLEALCSQTPDGDAAYYKLGLKHRPERFAGLSREHFATAMRAEGIALDAGFAGLHRSHARSRFRAAGTLIHADSAHEHVLTLHHPVLLGTGDELSEVVAAVQRIAAYAEEIRAATSARDGPA